MGPFLAWAERWSRWFPALFAVTYLIAFSLLARSKAWTYDEVIVEYLIGLPAFDDILAVLREGDVDKIPPLFYAMTRVAVAALGSGPVAYRAPEILAGLVMALCLYRFVACRAPAVYGAAAMLLPFVTQVRWLAYQARPGILAVAGIAAALVAWQAAGQDRWRPLSVLVLGASLAVAVSMHYYAAVSVLPLVAGELVRSYDRRRVDVPVWVALGAPAAPLLAFLPLIRGAMAPLDTFFAQPSWGQIWEFYPWVLGVGVGSTSFRFLIVAVIGIGLAWCVGRGPIAPPRHEAVAAWGLALVPVFGTALAMTVTRTYTPRYAVSAVVGIAVVLAWTAARWWRGSIALGLVLLVVVGAWAAVQSYGALSAARLEKRARAQAVGIIRANATDERPIVVSHGFAFLHLSHDAPPDLARRLVYLVDWKGAMWHQGNDTHERILTGLARRFPLDLRDYARFVASRPEFWLFAPRRRDAWIGHVLAREPTLRLLERARGEEGVLYFVAPR